MRARIYIFLILKFILQYTFLEMHSKVIEFMHDKMVISPRYF